MLYQEQEEIHLCNNQLLVVSKQLEKMVEELEWHLWEWAWHSRQAASMRRACMRWGSSNRWRHSRQQRMRQPKPVDDTWTCSCGAVNKGRFCSECGKPKPAAVKQYKCNKCGWVPEDPTNPPKFCPNCGKKRED